MSSWMLSPFPLERAVVSPAGLEPSASGSGRRAAKQLQSPEFWAPCGLENRLDTGLDTEPTLPGACLHAIRE